MNKYIISIVGPTGIGKTNLSLSVAAEFKTQIISSDSRQFFREIPIGTSSPNKTDLEKIPHHFIHHKSIHDNYSVGQFEKDALITTEKLFKKHNTLVLVGGSGLYVKAFLQGLNDFPKIDPKIRVQLNKDLKKNGIEFLQKELNSVDSISFSRIDLNNPHRLVRALEIFRGTGKSYSSFLHKTKKEKRNFEIINIGLIADRSIIYERINNRVDQMIKNGLVQEAKKVYRYRELNALNTVGYKELFQFFDGKCELDFAINEIKKNTRRFAKRQITWFKKQENINWFDYKTPYKKITSYLKNEIMD